MVEAEGGSTTNDLQPRVLTEYADQPLLYAFFYLALALAGDLGIATSLAAEGTLVRSKLTTQLDGYTNADEVRCSIVPASCC